MKKRYPLLLALAITLFSPLGICEPIRIAFSTFKASHLKKTFREDQVETLRYFIGKKSKFKTTSSRRESKVYRSINTRPDTLHKDPAKIKKYLRLLTADRLLFVEMILGTKKRAPKIRIKIFNQDGTLTQKVNVTFSGVISDDVWKMVANDVAQVLGKESEYSSISPSPPSYTPPPSTPPSIQQHQIPRSSNRPPPFSPNHQNHTQSQVTNDRTTTDRNIIDQAEVPSGRFTLLLGTSFSSKSFSYNTREGSRVLPQGLEFDSRWFPGLDVSVQFTPFSQNSKLSRLIFIGGFEQHFIKSLHVIQNLFDNNGLIELTTELTRLKAGLMYLHPLETFKRTHRLGVFLQFRDDRLIIEENVEYKGYYFQAIEIGLKTQLSIYGRTAWFDLEGSLIPLLSMGESVKELGETVESLGAAFGFAVNYRFNGGLLMKLHIGSLHVSQSISGVGRFGRAGEEASDRYSHIKISLGYSSL